MKPLFLWHTITKVLWQQFKPGDEQVLKLCSSKQRVPWSIKAWYMLRKIIQWLHRAWNGLISVSSTFEVSFWACILFFFLFCAFWISNLASLRCPAIGFRAIYIFHKTLVLHNPFSSSQNQGATRASKNAVGRQSLELHVELFVKSRWQSYY